MTELTITRTIAATPERVWRAFTTTELGSWMWPASWGTTSEVDLRVGGRYRIAAPAMAVGGEFVALDEPHRIVQTWQWDGGTSASGRTKIARTTCRGGTTASTDSSRGLSRPP